MAKRGLRRGVVWLTLVLAGFLGAAADAAPAGEPDHPLFGHWLSGKEKLIVEFYPCGDEVCGRIAWLAKPYKDGELRRDKHNPDPALRHRPFCGIEVIRGLEPDSDGVWNGGKVYDPKRGETYSLEVTQTGADELKLRAYIGLKIFGKSETWTRPDSHHEIACVPAS